MLELDDRQYKGRLFVTKNRNNGRAPEGKITLSDLADSVEKTHSADKIVTIKREGKRMEIVSKWESIAVVVIALVVGGYMIADSYFTNQVKIEAIKAGMAQDKDGHWIKIKP